MSSVGEREAGRSSGGSAPPAWPSAVEASGGSSPPVEEADAGERHAEVGGGLEVVAGEDAEAARSTAARSRRARTRGRSTPPPTSASPCGSGTSVGPRRRTGRRSGTVAGVDDSHDLLRGARPRRFADSNGDGIGDDSPGSPRSSTTSSGWRRLPLAAAVLRVAPGATAATTSPTSSPCNPDYGTVGDAAELIDEAAPPGHPGHRRHGDEPHLATSTRGSRSPAVPYQPPWRDWYVWNDDDRPLARGPGHLRPTPRPSNWAWDPVSPSSTTGTASSPPARPQLRQPRGADAMLDVVDFWLGLGVDGSASTRSRTCSSATAPTARTSPRPTTS
jgi:hypothetical protein